MYGGLLKSKLYDHQRANLAFHLSQRRTADFSEMGTGKTLTALAKIAHLIAKGEIKNVLIVCPMSAITSWALEIEKHSNLSYRPLLGQLFEKGELLTEYPNEDIYLTSYDSTPGRKRTKDILLNALLSFRFDMIVCDEVTFIKNYDTLRFRAVLQLCDQAEYVLFLTGTPISNRPDSIFNIYRALDKGETFGVNYFRARNKYFTDVGYAFPLWVMKETMKDELTHKIYLKAIRIRKDECLTLPPKILSPRYCNLSDEQNKVYIPVADELLKRFKVGEHRFRITTPLVKLSKLSQICSGFMYDNKGVAVYMKDNAKAELLKDVLEEIGDEKVIIFTRWREDQRIVEGVLGQHATYRILSGETRDRKEVIRAFQEDPKVRVLVSNIAVGGYAITLTASAYAIYYSLNFALTDWLQSQDRIHRVGQTKVCQYIPLLCNGTVDTYVFKALGKKKDLSTSIVDPELLSELVSSLGGN